jgi:hypothetical protein
MNPSWLEKLLSIAAVVVTALVPFTAAQERTENPSPSRIVLIRKDRPSVYVEFAKQGKAAPLFSGEREDRVWMSLHNNTPWGIEFCSLAVPAPLGDIGVVYTVKHISSTMGTVDFSNSPTPQQTVKPATPTPSGYSTGDTCTPYSIGSGRSVIFSVPRDHLAEELSIEIEFWYEWENRDNELGDYPECFVSFESSRLPKDGKVARH